MKNSLLLSAFVVMVIAQLYIPASMIWEREDILRTGQMLKFRTAPIDPSDPFRGKYVALDFEETSFRVTNAAEWKAGEPVYLSISTGEDGFAVVQTISRNRPAHTPFIKTRADYVSSDGSNQLYFSYPFDRYYLEESKAQFAETVYRDAASDTTTFAVVYIKDGNAVLSDVIINGKSIADIVSDTGEEMLPGN